MCNLITRFELFCNDSSCVSIAIEVAIQKACGGAMGRMMCLIHATSNMITAIKELYLTKRKALEKLGTTWDAQE